MTTEALEAYEVNFLIFFILDIYLYIVRLNVLIFFILHIYLYIVRLR